MSTLRFSMAALSLLFFAGWYWLHKPYSPTDDLPPVAYTAFEIHPPSDKAGELLADAARSWKGVTACTFNATSRLLVLSHETTLTEKELQGRLAILSSKTVSKKTFPEPTGPKCPVPQDAIAAIPGWLLGGAVISALGFLLTFLRKRKDKTTVSFALQP